jgi:hypothetical protein
MDKGSQGVSGVRGARCATAITAKDVCAGHKEKTQALLWSIMYHWQMPTLIDVPRLNRETTLLRRCYARCEQTLAMLEGTLPTTPAAAPEERVEVRTGLQLLPLSTSSPTHPPRFFGSTQQLLSTLSPVSFCGISPFHIPELCFVPWTPCFADWHLPRARPAALVSGCVCQVRRCCPGFQRVPGRWQGAVSADPPLPARPSSPRQDSARSC